MAPVEGDPVHLPAPEEALARCLYLGILERELSRRFLEDDLAHVRRIDRNPADALGEEFSAAMLRLADHRRRRTEALVAERGAGDADPIDVPRGNAQRPGEADEQPVEIRAFAAEIAALQHGLDVAGAAAPGLRVAHGVLHDPFVDAATLLQIGARALGGLHQRRLAYQSVARDHLRGRRIQRHFGAAEGRRAGSGEVDRAVASAELALQLDERPLGAGSPLGVEERHTVPPDAHLLQVPGIAVPGASETALPL